MKLSRSLSIFTLLLIAFFALGLFFNVAAQSDSAEALENLSENQNTQDDFIGDEVYSPIEYLDPSSDIFEDSEEEGEGRSLPNPVGAPNLPSLAQNILETLWLFAIPIAVIMFAYSGYIFLFARGEPDKIKSAKQTLMYTVIGLVILLLAQGVVSIIKNIIG